MYCPHCKNEIADGSNICPLCFSSLNGYMEEDDGAAYSRKSSGSHKRSGRGKRRGSSAPTIVAVGIIILLLVAIVFIVRSMFFADTTLAIRSNTPTPQPTLSGNFVVFGATATPNPARTATPNIAVTATPEPEPEDDSESVEAAIETANYRTLRKGDSGAEVVLLQEALTTLGYLTTASDGIYGTGTATAVKAFQSDNGLDSDGIAGRQTQARLFQLANVTPVPVTTPAPGEILDLPG